MTRAELEAALRRSIESGDDVTAQELSIALAPYVEQQCDAMDNDPKAIVPAWNTYA
jgi:hypothetical protein